MNLLTRSLLTTLPVALLTGQSIAAPETYVIDSKHTFPRFSYSHFGFSMQQSQFDNTTGVIVLDRVARTGSVEVTMDMKSVNTGSTLFNEHIQRTDFLDTSHYPTARFQSTQVSFKGEQPDAIQGNLTIKGITKPVTLKVESFQLMHHPMLKKDALGANASTTIKRSEFNAGQYAPQVGDDMTIDIAVEAIRE